VTCVGFSPNGALLATADSNRELLLWDTQTMQVIIFITFIVITISTAAIIMILILFLIIYDLKRRQTIPLPRKHSRHHQHICLSHYSHYYHAGQPERLAVSLR
jgi:hypothetical protein